MFVCVFQYKRFDFHPRRPPAGTQSPSPHAADAQPLAVAVMQRQVVLVASSAESGIAAWCVSAAAALALCAPATDGHVLGLRAATIGGEVWPRPSRRAAEPPRACARRDLHNGTFLTAYKGNASPRNGLCTLGADYLLAAQAGKDALQFWTWHKVGAPA